MHEHIQYVIHCLYQMLSLLIPLPLPVLFMVEGASDMSFEMRPYEYKQCNVVMCEVCLQWCIFNRYCLKQHHSMNIHNRK